MPDEGIFTDPDDPPRPYEGGVWKWIVYFVIALVLALIVWALV